MPSGYRYGFRVYEFKAAKSGRGKPLDLCDPSYAFQDRLVGILKKNLNKELKYRPNLRAVEHSEPPIPEEDRGEPIIIIDEVKAIDNRVSIDLIYGLIGDHDDLLGGELEQISDRAAGRRYRIEILFPKAGESGILLAETCVSYTPVSFFLRWLAQLDRERSAEHQKALAEIEKTDDETLDQYKERKLEAQRLAMWIRLKEEQVADANHLREIVRSADHLEVSFAMAGAFTKRGRARDIRHKLHVRDVGSGVQSDVADELAKWLEGNTSKSPVNRLLGVLDFKRKKMSNAGLRFNNVAVHVYGKENLTVAPEFMRDLFTYPLSEQVRPDLDVARQRWRDKVRELALIKDIPIATI